MNQTEGFRHEMKYRIGYAQYIEMRNRLRTVMQSDMHTGTDGKYLIRSIYFDNYADKALREKTDGVPVREKFRIRYYNDDFSYLTLEKKIKDNDLCMKIDARITEITGRQNNLDDGAFLAAGAGAVREDALPDASPESACIIHA